MATLRILFLVVAALALSACGRPTAKAPEQGLTHLRRAGPKTKDADIAARWLLAELIYQGGDAAQAERARHRLDELKKDSGIYGHLARGIDDWMHGRLKTAPDHYLEAVAAARGSDDPRAPYVAWMAAHQAVLLSDNSPGLWDRWRDRVDEMVAKPMNIGWRARSELLDWWSIEEDQKAQTDIENETARRFGCAEHVRLAGPFGTGAKRDLVRSFPAEAPGPWPSRWKREPDRGSPPRVLDTDQNGCVVYADEAVVDGIFYAETFVELASDQEVLVAVQGALAVWVDDQQVLERDPREWGVWTRFGARLWLHKGRHRVLAKVDSPHTSVRLTMPDGRPIEAKTSTDAAPGYTIEPPKVMPDPNLVSRHLDDANIVAPKDELLRFLVAYLAYADGQGDMAALFFEPFVEDLEAATGPSLVLSALFAESDPVYPPTQVQDLVRELQLIAIERDPKLWQAQLALALWKADQAGPTKALKQVRRLSAEFKEVPAISIALARLYARLGWMAELTEAVKELARRYPHSEEVLVLALEVYEEEGDHAKVDELIQRIQKLDPDSEVLLTRALEMEDYDTAVEELERLGKRRPDRKDIAERVQTILVRAGDTSKTWKRLQTAVENEPKNGWARLALADAHFAAGKNSALREALVDGVTAGASIDPIEAAIDLVEGVTELEPYRLQAKPIIAEYEASGRQLPGHAVRVLDYMAVWVKSDGSARLLEHEVVRIQSSEAAKKMGEHPQLSGLPLHMRVIKKDGRVLEPEIVPGKPTVTLPHLEVGDYIETEHIFSTSGDGDRGTQYVGPHWFFREENVAYARSEFVVISPKGKDLFVEYAGNAPEPKREDVGAFEVRRWRVDESPAAPDEPNAPPQSEFFPSVRIAWGISHESRLRRLHDNAIDLTPVDPRIVRIAERIVKGVPASAERRRAKRLYRWVLANVEDGDEGDGRRVVIGKEGYRARGFETLCRALDIKVDYAIVRNRLAPPPRGEISRALLYDEMVLRVGRGKEATWLTVGSKFAPFGYVPVEVRGMPAYIVSGSKPKKTKVNTKGSIDGVEYVARVKLAANGSAKVYLTQSFHGVDGVRARDFLSQVPERRQHDVLQAFVAQSLRGAILTDHRLVQLDDLDSPLTIKMDLEMSRFAQPRGKELIVQPPYAYMVSDFTALPERETPLLIASDTYHHVFFNIELPEGATVSAPPRSRTIEYEESQVQLEYKVEQDHFVLEHTIRIPAGRIQPEVYPKFARFARRADEAQTNAIHIELP